MTTTALWREVVAHVTAHNTKVELDEEDVEGLSADEHAAFAAYAYWQYRGGPCSDQQAIAELTLAGSESALLVAQFFAVQAAEAFAADAADGLDS